MNKKIIISAAIIFALSLAGCSTDKDTGGGNTVGEGASIITENGQSTMDELSPED